MTEVSTVGIKAIGRTMAVSVAMAGVGYLAYTYAIPAEKKVELETRFAEAKSRAYEIVEAVRPYVDQMVRPAPADHSNREATIRQWETLVY